MYAQFDEKSEEVKKTLSEKVDYLLDDEKKLKDFVTILKTILIFVIFTLYFGFQNSFSFHDLLPNLLNISLLGILGIVGNKTLVSDFRDRAYKDEIRNNEKLKTLLKDIETKSSGFNKYIDLCITFINDFNNEQQNRANKLKTNQRKTKLENKKRICKIKGKTRKANRLEKKINFLNDNLLVYKRYKYISLSSLVSIKNSNNTSNIIGGNAIKYNPKSTKWYTKSLTLLKFIGFGGGGTIAFKITDFHTFINFIILFVIFAGYGCFNNYIKVRRKTKTIYFQSLKNKNDLLNNMFDYCNKESNDKEFDIKTT